MARKVSYQFNPYEIVGKDSPSSHKRGDAMYDMADAIKEEILGYMESANSPVKGYGRFPALSKAYKSRKSALGGSSIADLELFGDMKAALQVRPNVRRGVITVEVIGKQGDKADGHNNHSGDSSLPLRRFIPADGETFKRAITSKIRGLASE